MSILETLLDFSVNDINQISWNTISRTQAISHPFTILTDLHSFCEANPSVFRRYGELHDYFLPILYTVLSNTDISFQKEQANKLCLLFGAELDRRFPQTVPTDKPSVDVVFEYIDQSYAVMVKDRSIFDMSILGNFSNEKKPFSVSLYENRPKYRYLAKAYAWVKPRAVVEETIVDETRIDSAGKLGPVNKSYFKDLLTLHIDRDLDSVADSLMKITAYRQFVDNIKKNQDAIDMFGQLLDYERVSLDIRMREHNITNLDKKSKRRSKAELQLIEDYARYEEASAQSWVSSAVESSKAVTDVPSVVDTSLDSTIAVNVANCFTKGWKYVNFSKENISNVLRAEPVKEELKAYQAQSVFFNVSSSDDDEEEPAPKYVDFEDEYVQTLASLMNVDEERTNEGFAEFRRRAVAEGYVTENGKPKFQMGFKYNQKLKQSNFGKVTALPSNNVGGKVNHTMNLVALQIIDDQSSDDEKKMVHSRAIIMQLRNFLKLLLTRLFDYSEIEKHRQMIYERINIPIPAEYAGTFSGNYRTELFDKAVKIITVCGNIQGIPVSSITRECVNAEVMQRYATTDRYLHELLRTIDPQLPTLDFEVENLIADYTNYAALRNLIGMILTELSTMTLEQFMVETTIENTMSSMAWSKSSKEAFKFKSSMMSYYLLSLVCDLFTADRAEFDFTSSELFSNNQYASILRPKIVRPYDFQVRFLNTIFDDMNNYDLNLESILNFRMIEHLRFSTRFPENRRMLSNTLEKLVAYSYRWQTGEVWREHPNLNRKLIEAQTGPFMSCNWHFGHYPRHTFTDRVPFNKIFSSMPAQAMNNLSRTIPIDMMISILNAMTNQCLGELEAKKQYVKEVNRLILYSQRVALLLFCQFPEKLKSFQEEVLNKNVVKDPNYVELLGDPAVAVMPDHLYQEERRMAKILSTDELPVFQYDMTQRLTTMYAQYKLFTAFLDHGTNSAAVMATLKEIMNESIQTLHFTEAFLERIYDKFSNAPLCCPTMHPFVKLRSVVNDEQITVNFPEEFLESTNFYSAAEVYGQTVELTVDEQKRYPALLEFLRKLQSMKLACRIPYVDLEALAVLLDHRGMDNYNIGNHDEEFFTLDFTDSGHVFVTSSVENPRVASVLASKYPAEQEHSNIVYTPSRPKNVYVLNAMTNTGKTTLSIMLANLIYKQRLKFSVIFVTDVEEIENEVVDMMKSMGMPYLFVNPDRYSNKYEVANTNMVEDDEETNRLLRTKGTMHRSSKKNEQYRTAEVTSKEFIDCRFFLATSAEARTFIDQNSGRRFIPFIDEPTAKTGSIYIQQMMELLSNRQVDADMDRICSLIGSKDTTMSMNTRRLMKEYVQKCFACTSIIRNHDGLCVLSGSTVPSIDVLLTLNPGCTVKDYPLSRINMSVNVQSFAGYPITPLDAMPPESQESLRKLNDCPLVKRLLSIKRFKDFSEDQQEMYQRMVSFDQFTGQEILNFYMFTLFHNLKAQYMTGNDFMQDNYINDLDKAIAARKTTSESIVQNVMNIIPSMASIRANVLDRMPIVSSPVSFPSIMPEKDKKNRKPYSTKTIIFTDDPEQYALAMYFPDTPYDDVIDYVNSHTGTLQEIVDTTDMENQDDKTQNRDQSRDQNRNRDAGKLRSQIDSALMENIAAARHNRNILFDEADKTSAVQKFLMTNGIRLVDESLRVDKNYLQFYSLDKATTVISDASGAYGLNIDKLENCVITDKFAVCNSTSTILQALSRVGREKHTVANARMSEFCMFKCALFALSNASFIHRLVDIPNHANDLQSIYNAAFLNNFTDIDYSLFVNMVYATIKSLEHAFRMPESDSPFVNATSYTTLDGFVQEYKDVSNLIFELVPSKFNLELAKVLKNIVIPSLVNTQESRIMTSYIKL